jgi:hypothetical protein
VARAALYNNNLASLAEPPRVPQAPRGLFRLSVSVGKFLGCVLRRIGRSSVLQQVVCGCGLLSSCQLAWENSWLW